MKTTASHMGAATVAKWAFWIVLALLPVGLLSLFAFQTASRSVNDYVRTSSLAAAMIGADFVRDDLYRSLSLTLSIAESPGFVAAVRDRDEEEVRARLRSIILFYPPIDRGFVHSVDGEVWSNFPERPELLGKSYLERDWYQGVSLNWEPYVSEVYLRDADPQMKVVAMAVPIFDDDQEVIGILVTQCRLGSISAGLRHVRLGESGSVYLLDPNGIVAGHPNLDLRNQLYDDFRNLEVVRETLEADARGGRFADGFRDPLTGEEMVATFLPVSITSREWLLVAQQPRAEAYAPIRTIAWNIGGAGAILALAAAVVMVGLWRANEKNRNLNRKLGEGTVVLQDQTKRLRDLAAQLTSAEQRERKRLAALLHDDLQQLLVAANMRLKGISRRVADELVKETLREVGEWIDTVADSARDLTHELRPPALYEDGLPAALQWLASRMWKLHKLSVRIDSPEFPRPLSDDMKALLFDCVRELLFNVVKHARVEKAVVRLYERDDSLCVIVEDQGRGFDIETKARTKSEEGFGLFSIRERLTALGCTMEIDSRSGRGTRITLTIPLSVARPGDSAQGAVPNETKLVPEKAEAGEVNERMIRVLVVDDHAMVRQGLANILRSDGRIEVVGEVANGLEAIEAVGRQHPNVVLMDLNMPRMNGIEATREIHRQWPEVHVIGLSVQHDDITAQSMRAAGAEAFLSKGGDADRMIATIIELTAFNHDPRNRPAA